MEMQTRHFTRTCTEESHHNAKSNIDNAMGQSEF